MIKTTRNTSLAIIVIAMFGLNACATTDSRNTSEYAASNVSYEVKPGDRLSGIALKLTGHASNWKLIAAHNNISSPKSLAAGETILIPNSLLDQAYAINSKQTTQARNSFVDMNTSRTNNTPAPLSITTGQGVSVARGREIVVNDIAPISVSPVEVNRSFSLQPLEQPVFSMLANKQSNTSTLQIKVAGTYYPKGLYAEPANYARLVGRVSPGTVFPLESKVNDWYKVMTDQGIRYIRKSDTVLLK